MTSLLVLVVIALVSIAVWQLTKIFDLTQIGSNVDNSQVANDNDNNVNGYLNVRIFNLHLFNHYFLCC